MMEEELTYLFSNLNDLGSNSSIPHSYRISHTIKHTTPTTPSSPLHSHIPLPTSHSPSLLSTPNFPCTHCAVHRFIDSRVISKHCIVLYPRCLVVLPELESCSFSFAYPLYPLHPLLQQTSHTTFTDHLPTHILKSIYTCIHTQIHITTKYSFTPSLVCTLYL